MKKKYRIAWIGKKSPFCGNVTYCREVVRLLEERGHEILFIHFSDRAGVAAEVAIPYLYTTRSYTIPSLNASKILSQALEDWQPDIVHGSLPLSALDYSLPEICRRLNKPLVVTFHSAFDRRTNFYSGTSYLHYQTYATNLSECDRVIIFSNLHKQLLERIGVSSPRIEIIPNGIDPAKFSPGPSAFRERHPDQFIMTYMGRISIEKGIDNLLKVFKKLALPNALLVIVGDGGQRQLLQSLYSEVKNIVWTGALADEQERIDILRGSDVFVLPSQVEGLSIALLEAMACGAAPVATDVGSDGEVLENGAGIVIEPGRIKSQLAFALQLLQQQPEYVRLLQAKARQRVLERYTLDRNIDHIESIYTHLLQEREAIPGLTFPSHILTG